MSSGGIQRGGGNKPRMQATAGALTGKKTKSASKKGSGLFGGRSTSSLGNRMKKGLQNLISKWQGSSGKSNVPEGFEITRTGGGFASDLEAKPAQLEFGQRTVSDKTKGGKNAAKGGFISKVKEFVKTHFSKSSKTSSLDAKKVVAAETKAVASEFQSQVEADIKGRLSNMNDSSDQNVKANLDSIILTSNEDQANTTKPLLTEESIGSAIEARGGSKKAIGDIKAQAGGNISTQEATSILMDEVKGELREARKEALVEELKSDFRRHIGGEASMGSGSKFDSLSPEAKSAVHKALREFVDANEGELGLLLDTAVGEKLDLEAYTELKGAFRDKLSDIAAEVVMIDAGSKFTLSPEAIAKKKLAIQAKLEAVTKKRMVLVRASTTNKSRMEGMTKQQTELRTKIADLEKSSKQTGKDLVALLADDAQSDKKAGIQAKLNTQMRTLAETKKELEDLTNNMAKVRGEGQDHAILTTQQGELEAELAMYEGFNGSEISADDLKQLIAGELKGNQELRQNVMSELAGAKTGPIGGQPTDQLFGLIKGQVTQVAGAVEIDQEREAALDEVKTHLNNVFDDMLSADQRSQVAEHAVTNGWTPSNKDHQGLIDNYAISLIS